MLKFNFTFKWVDDGNYGSKKEESNEWNGMIGELMDGVSEIFWNVSDVLISISSVDIWYFPMLVLLQEIQFQKADLAIADLTINTPRNDAIDFSMPFMKLGLFWKGIQRTEFYTI